MVGQRQVQANCAVLVGGTPLLPWIIAFAGMKALRLRRVPTECGQPRPVGMQVLALEYPAGTL